MPSSSLKKYLEELIYNKKDKFEDNFDIEWNLFSTLCMIRTEQCLAKKSEQEKQEFKDFFTQKCETKTEKINFFLKDPHFKEDLDDLFLNFLKDSGIACESKKSATVSRYFCDSAKFKVSDNPEKALVNYNMALLYCPYPKDATNLSDSLLFVKILLKRAELICLNLKIEEALANLEEGFKLLEEMTGDERNLMYCKLLYAKFAFLDLINSKDHEERDCKLLDQKVKEFNLNGILKEKLDKYNEFLIHVFTMNKEVIKKECTDKKSKSINLNTLKANSKLPGAASNIELCMIKGKGRCTRATKTIEDGTIITVENPIAEWLRPTMYKFYCNNCFIRVKNYFLPCFKCIKVKYCSSKCRDEAWDKYHSIECKFLEFLRYFGFGHLVLRTMIIFDQDEMMNFLVNDQIHQEINQSKDDDRKIFQSKEKPKSTSLKSLITDVDNGILSERAKFESTDYIDNSYWVENGFPSKIDYKTFFSLFGDEKHLGFLQLISFCYGVSLISLLAERMKLIDKSDRFYYIFHSALLSHILKINFNCYSINDHNLRLLSDYGIWTHSDFTKIGIGLYLSSSIISHSCDYNANKLSIGSKIVMYANQKIDKGQEITHTYGPSFRISSFKDRQSMLKNGYLFECKCNPCLNKLDNYPNAFKCTNCEVGILIWNQDYSNECLKCGTRNQDLNVLINLLSQVQEEFNVAYKLLSNKNYTQCKQKLIYCKKMLKSIFYSEQKLEHLYRLYMEYYYRREKYRKASKYATILSKLEKEKEDKETLESILCSIKSLSLLVEHYQNSTYTFASGFSQHVPKRILFKIRDKYLKILENFNEIISRQVKTIEDGYTPYLDCFKTVDKFLENC